MHFCARRVYKKRIQTAIKMSLSPTCNVRSMHASNAADGGAPLASVQCCSSDITGTEVTLESILKECSEMIYFTKYKDITVSRENL